MSVGNKNLKRPLADSSHIPLCSSFLVMCFYLDTPLAISGDLAATPIWTQMDAAFSPFSCFISSSVEDGGVVGIVCRRLWIVIF